MPSKKLTRSLRLYLIGVCILVAGLLGATTLYLTASDDSGDVLGYEFIDGQAYALHASDSKMYRRNLEQFGGKAAIFADDLNRWLSSLWRGKRLATTVGVLAATLALFFFRAGWLCRKKEDHERQ